MSSSSGHFNLGRKKKYRRKRFQYCIVCALVFLIGWYQLQPVLDSPNLSIIGASNFTHSRPNKKLSKRNVPWQRLLIPSKDLGRMDYFSDSWLMTRQRFLRIDVKAIEMVEDACFQVIDDNAVEGDLNQEDERIRSATGTDQNSRNKMFVDWTDFSVEHLSKWWKNLHALSHSNSGMADQVVRILEQYLYSVRQAKMPFQDSSSSFPKQSIAVISFQSYESAPPVGSERGHRLTASSLAATIASLYRIGFGRIIVGGYQQPSDSNRVQEALDLLDSIFHNPSSNNQQGGKQQDDQPSLVIGDTKIVYVQLESSWVQTKRVSINIPRGVLMGMQNALSNKLPPVEQAKWVGTTPEQWRYFYLTEPDTILNTRPEIIPLLQIGLDHGLVFFPHRWQPIPHEDDLPSHYRSFLSPSSYVPQDVEPFSNITIIHSPWNETTTTSNGNDGVSYCCDGGKDKPGRSESFGTKMKPCGKWWWACGFSSSSSSIAPLTATQALEQHKRLVPYPMMRLQGGTSVIVAASEFGRRCFPSRIPCSVVAL